MKLDINKTFELLRTLVAICIALAIAFLLILLVSERPIETFKLLLLGPLKSSRYIGNVIELAIPLGFAGIATGLLFRTNLFNLGAEGIFYISGLAATVVALNVEGTFMKPFLAILAAALLGMLLNGLTGLLKAKWQVNELVVSLMFNSIFFGIGFYILNNFLRDPSLGEVASYKFTEGHVLGRLFQGTRIHYGLIILFIVALIMYVFIFKTTWGYKIRMTGHNKDFANYMGIKTLGVIISVHLISGFIAGMGGAIEVLGMYDRFRWAALPGLGFDGALIALLGKNHPLKAISASLFLAYIRIGADLMSRLSDVPSEMVAIIQAVIILLISAERFLFHLRNKMLLKEVK